jgi:serine/threonine protein kinase
VRPPRDFENYELLEEVGRGGMAWVFKARDKDLGNHVAVKILFPELAEDPTLVKRFQSEAENAAALNHPNIVPALRRGVFQGWLFLVMPFLAGRNLKVLLADQKRLPLDIALLVVRDACLALDYAHQHETVHRDVKPSNVILTYEGEVKLTDFGLARRIDSDATRTQPGTVLGSRPYMPREQRMGKVLGPEDLKLVDVFAMGATAYELLSGTPAFPGSSGSEIDRAIDAGPPESLALKNPLVPEPVVRVIKEMLIGNPSKRCPSIGLVLEVLEKAIEGEQVHGERGRLRAFAQEPSTYFARWRERRIDQHRTAADLYAEQKVEKRDEAIHELDCALFLDPQNGQLRQWREQLKDLSSIRRKPDEPRSGSQEKSEEFLRIRRPGIRPGIFATAALIIALGGALGLWWWMSGGWRGPGGVRMPDPTPQSADSAALPPGTVDTLPASAPMPATESMPAPKAAPAPERKPTPTPLRIATPTPGAKATPDSASSARPAAPVALAPPLKPVPELPCTLYVNLTGECQAARVTIDNQIESRQNRAIELRAGKQYTVRVSNPACGDTVFAFTAKSGESLHVRLNLSRRR